MTIEEAKHFAEHWVEAWNSHDLDAILSHYTHDLEMTTPMIRSILGIQSGTLRGKNAVGDYWRTALERVPDLAFSLIEVTAGVGVVSIYYNSIAGRKAIETFFFNENGKVYRALATYA